MAKEVILTPIAINDLEKLIEYLSSEWGIAVANRFLSRFENVTSLLADNPGIFPYFDKHRHIQRCVVTKHNILYFIEKELEIHIITIFDTRQDPDKLNDLL